MNKKQHFPRQSVNQSAKEVSNPIAEGLRAMVSTVETLMSCEDSDSLYRQAVEFCREKLGLERCAIYVEKDGYLQGTYGTDLNGCTTDEHTIQLPLSTSMHAGHTWEAWKERLRQLRPQDRRWVTAEVDHWAWVDEKNVIIGQGWVAVTLIQTPGGEFAVLFNDTAISGTPFDEAKQEIVAIFCSLLGSITKPQPSRYRYNEVANLLREDILNNIYAEKIPGERVLAQKYNMNIKTINRAVSQLIDEGWLYRLKGKGTFVKDIPKFVESKPISICFITPSLICPRAIYLIQNLQAKIKGHNARLVIEMIDTNEQDVKLIIDQIWKQNIDCLIVWDTLFEIPVFEEILQKIGVPSVGFCAYSKKIDTVNLNFKIAAQKLTEYLISKSGSPIAFMANEQKNRESDLIFSGYKGALRANQQPVERKWVLESKHQMRDGFQWIEKLTQKKQCPNSVFFTEEELAIGAELALHVFNDKYEGEVEFAGFLDTPTPKEMRKNTSFACIPYAEAATQLIELSKRRIESPSASIKHITIDYDLIFSNRDSSSELR